MLEDPPTGRSSNGKTAASGAAYRGSNPCLPANNLSTFQSISYKRKPLGVREIVFLVSFAVSSLLTASQTPLSSHWSVHIGETLLPSRSKSVKSSRQRVSLSLVPETGSAWWFGQSTTDLDYEKLSRGAAAKADKFHWCFMPDQEYGSGIPAIVCLAAVHLEKRGT